jgi:hypothetical protein
MWRRLPGVSQGLIHGTGMSDDVCLAVDVIFPRTDGRQLSGRTFDAALASWSPLAALANWSLNPGRANITSFALGADLASLALRPGGADPAAFALRASLAGWTTVTSHALWTLLAPFTLRAGFALLTPQPTLALRARGTDLTLRAHRTWLTTLPRRAVPELRQSCIDLGAQLGLQLHDLGP